MRAGLRTDQPADILACCTATLPEEPSRGAVACSTATALPRAPGDAATAERKNSDGAGFRGGKGGRHSGGQ